VGWLHDHPRAADATLAGVLAVLSVVFHLTVRDPELAEPHWWSPFLVIASIVPLIWRRRSPLVVLVLVSAGEFTIQVLDMLGSGFLSVLIAAYTFGAYVSGRRLWVAGALSAVALSAFIVLGIAADQADWQALVSTVALYGAAIVFGDNMRRRRERAAELVERAERAEREKDLLAHQQVQQERTRIARELHDVVAHSLSVMIIQAGAARRRIETDPALATSTLLSIEDAGREAMSEMRRILGVLRSTEGTGTAPQPSLAALSDLIAASSDLPVAVHTSGDLTAVPPAIELSAYRVVQEALTNVRRHAGRVDTVDVDVSRDHDNLIVSVDDNGRGASALAVDPGFGIIGMRERVSMFGGHLEAGPRVGGGWRVRATFPLVAS
jgi:signal transduction histidine kinase